MQIRNNKDATIPLILLSTAEMPPNANICFWSALTNVNNLSEMLITILFCTNAVL